MLSRTWRTRIVGNKLGTPSGVPFFWSATQPVLSQNRGQTCTKKYYWPVQDFPLNHNILCPNPRDPPTSSVFPCQPCVIRIVCGDSRDRLSCESSKKKSSHRGKFERLRYHSSTVDGAALFFDVFSKPFWPVIGSPPIPLQWSQIPVTGKYLHTGSSQLVANHRLLQCSNR